MIGQEISHYKITEEIGKGGMGVVYKGFDTRLKRYAAIKILPKEFMKDQDRKTRFFQEARAASQVSHPNIAHIYDIGEEGDISFIAMEYVEGESLRHRMAKGTIPLTEALKIATQVSDALGKAHESGIVHRDIKPENIMITKDGYAKILDFGLAKVSGFSAALSTEDESETVTIAQTMAGVIMGTVAYMSPEQAMGRQVDSRSDIFSLGLVIYEMAAGKQPFSAKSNIQLLNEIIEKPLPTLAETGTALPLNLEKIIKKATEKNPQDRYSSGMDMAAELRDLTRQVETGIYVPITPPGIAARLKSLVRGRNLYISLGVLGILLIAVLSYFIGTIWKLSPVMKPTVAVLYFENLSSDKEADAYFRDGMTEDIITELSKINGITVLLRNTVIAYKDKIVGADILKKEIGADYVLEGSIQKVVDKLRINTRLIDAASGSAVWADNYDTDLKNVFEVQSDISKQIATALKVKITREEEGRLEKKGTKNLDAYNNYLKGKAYAYKFTKNNIEPAIKFFEKAIELDPNYSLAYSALSNAFAAMYSYFEFDEIWLDRAMDAAEKALSLDNELPEAHAALAEAYRLKGMLDESLEEIKKEAELRPESEDFLTEYHNNLGMTYSDKGQKDKAEEQFRASISYNRPSSWMAHANLANALREKGIFEEALQEAEQAIEMHPDHEQPYREKAKIQIDTKQYYEAEILLKRSIEIAPDNIAPYKHLIDLYKMQKRYDGAAAMMRSFIDEYPYVMGGYLLLKEIYDAMGKADDGITVMEEAVKRNPDKFWAYRRLGVVYFRLKRFQDAISTFEKGLKVREDAVLYNNIGVAHKELGNYEKAIMSFEKAIQVNPSQWAAYYNLGNVYDTLEKYDQAEEYIKKAIEIKSDIEDYYWKLYSVLQKVGRYKEIISFLEGLVEKQPDNRVLLNCLGGIYYQLCDFENAAKNFKKALEINALPQLYSNLGETYMQMGRFAEAEAEIKKAIELKPDYQDAYYRLAMLQIYKNNFKNAEKMLKENAEKFPNNSKFPDRLGYLYVIQGRCQEAEAQFKRVEEMEPFIVRCGMLSTCYRKSMNDGKANELLAKSEKKAETILDKKPDDMPAMMGLIQCYAQKGMEAQALEIVEKIGKLDPFKKNYYLASAYCLLGKNDRALEYLRIAKEEGVRNFVEWQWDINLLPLKDHPEFKKLIAS